MRDWTGIQDKESTVTVELIRVMAVRNDWFVTQVEAVMNDVFIDYMSTLN